MTTNRKSKSIYESWRLSLLEGCILSDDGNASEEYREICRNAGGDLKKIANRILAEDGLRMTQAYAQESRANLDDRHWYRVRCIVGKNCRKASAVSGGLLIGNGSFSLIIPAGVDNAVIRYAVLPKGSFNYFMVEHYMTLEADKIRVYHSDDDCLLSGRFQIYSNRDGIVIFERD